MNSLSQTGSDRAIGAVLFAGSFGYLFGWPHILGGSDESHLLYHGKVVLEGGLPYRDFFEFYTPLANYVVALLFALFGVQIATIKVAMAVLHAGIVALMYLGARALSVRVMLAVVACLTYLGLGQPSWPFASPHWIATLLLLWILLILLKRPLARAQLLRLGTLSGVITSMQHQTGVPILVGIAIVISLEPWLDRRLGEPPGDLAPSGATQSSPTPSHSTLSKLLHFAAPAIAIPALILALHLVFAGFEPMFEQLLLHPLTSYREYNRMAWGSVGIMSMKHALYTYPKVLAWLPVALLPLAGWRLVRAWRSRNRFEFERVSTLSIFSIATALTVVNRPDFIHLAFIVAIYLLFWAETLEWGFAKVFAAQRLGPWVSGLAIVLLLAIGLHLQRNYERAWEFYQFPAETEFGRIDFSTLKQVKLFETVHAALESEPERKLFCYPVVASLYLTADAHNPTMHEIMVPGYLTPEQYREAIDVLERERLRYVVMMTWASGSGPDPMFKYIRSHYRCANGEDKCSLYQRMD